MIFLLRRRGKPWRVAVIHGALLWGMAVWAITEGLGALSGLSFGWVLAAWCGLTAVAVLIGSGAGRRDAAESQAPEVRLDVTSRLWLVALVVIASVLGTLALVAPPNTWDSMTYHMSRVMHWMQNGGVAAYPTNIPRQLYQPPWSEFAIAQLVVLAGGDRLANLVQWLAMLGCLVGVSLIARELGGDARAQVLASVVAATIPVGILQASGTQNDYTLAFWLVCLVALTLERRRRSEQVTDLHGAALIGAALGLVLLTKATGYLFAWPFMAWMAIGEASRRRRGALVLAVVLLTAVAVNAPYYWRNVTLSGSPLGPRREGDFAYVNASFSLRVLTSNLVRNMALHLGTPSPGANRLEERLVLAAHRVLRLDVNDPGTTWRGEAFRVTRPSRHEDAAGNGLHALSIALAIVGVVSLPRFRRSMKLLTYCMALLAAFAAFCLILRWQPWHSRLHLPLFVLWSPAIAVVSARWRPLSRVVALALIVASIPWLLWNGSRPLVGSHGVFARSRETQYFANRPALREPYERAVSAVTERGCDQIGLVVDGNGWEYPLWVLSSAARGGPVRIEHIAVHNESATTGRAARFAGFRPCAVILVDSPDTAAPLDGGQPYRLALSVPPVRVLVSP